MEAIIGFIAALVIGFTLGLLGGGGSILTVPAFVYLLGIDPVTATAYSLFVVGAASLVGSVSYMRKGLLSYKTAAIFAIPSFIAVFLTRKFLVPAIPETLFTIAETTITKDIGIMVFFAVIMLLASYSMIKGNKKEEEKEEEIQQKFNYPMIFLEGAVVGTVTGIVGAGGGFLIVPALVLLAKLDMKLAVGTSLLIIAVKSLIGFTGDLTNTAIDWNFLLIFTAFTIVGILIGSYANQFVPAAKLKKGFGWFVLAMGIYIIVKELFI